jgi:hypothetical protein
MTEAMLADRLMWHGCKMANAGCPEDLCVLPDDGHKGHELGTSARGQKTYIRSKSPRAVRFMVPDAKSVRDLINAGVDRQRELWPED